MDTMQSLNRWKPAAQVSRWDQQIPKNMIPSGIEITNQTQSLPVLPSCPFGNHLLLTFQQQNWCRVSPAVTTASTSCECEQRAYAIPLLAWSLHLTLTVLEGNAQQTFGLDHTLFSITSDRKFYAIPATVLPVGKTLSQKFQITQCRDLSGKDWMECNLL